MYVKSFTAVEGVVCPQDGERASSVHSEKKKKKVDVIVGPSWHIGCCFRLGGPVLV